MKNLEFSLDERFYRCHRSFIINREHIQYIDFKNRTIIMSNQEVCLASEKHLKKLKNSLIGYFLMLFPNVQT